MRGAGAAKRAFDVDVEYLIPYRIGEPFEIGELDPMGHTGVVDDNIETAELIFDL